MQFPRTDVDKSYSSKHPGAVVYESIMNGEDLDEMERTLAMESASKDQKERKLKLSVEKIDAAKLMKHPDLKTVGDHQH